MRAQVLFAFQRFTTISTAKPVLKQFGSLQASALLLDHAKVSLAFDLDLS